MIYTLETRNPKTHEWLFARYLHAVSDFHLGKYLYDKHGAIPRPSLNHGKYLYFKVRETGEILRAFYTRP